MRVLKTCICGAGFSTTTARVKAGRGKFCSKQCQYKNAKRPSGLTYVLKQTNPTSFKKGHIPWHKDQLIKSWEDYGSDMSYRHKVIRKMFGSPTECEQCGTDQNLQWSNVSGKYLGERDDWQQLCTKCHQRYDYENFGARTAFFN